MDVMLFLLGFVIGLIVAGLMAFRVLKRQLNAWQADPFLTPKAEIVHRLRRAVMDQIHRWHDVDYRVEAAPPREVHEVLNLLAELPNWRGVWTQEAGAVVLPDGERILIAKLMQEIRSVLLGAYVALDKAAAVVLDYHDILPASGLDEPGQLLYSRKQPFELECVALARLLGVDPDANHLAQHGRDRLWQVHLDIQQRRFQPSHSARFMGLLQAGVVVSAQVAPRAQAGLA